jgi:alanine transaminase
MKRVTPFLNASFKRNASTSWVTRDSLNSNLLEAQYAVRGEMVLRAQSHLATLRGSSSSSSITSPNSKLPFDKLVFCNIGNPMELGQKPISFFRQVTALLTMPALIDDPRSVAIFPPDAIVRARAYMNATNGSGIGAYTHSQGIELIRKEVAQFITRRDGGIESNADDVFLTDGASPAVQMILKALIRGRNDAIMVPVPQYPLYSASIALFGGSFAPFYLNEEKGWSLDLPELERSIAEARSKGLNVRALVVINPGNPTGNSLSEANIRDVLAFASREKLVVLADEVYQENVYVPDRPFISFKKVAVQMGLLNKHGKIVDPSRGLQLASFHSTSKGFTGECGRRGGYVELCGFDAGVHAELYKLASISLCSNTAGQVTVGLQALPPQPGDASHSLYIQERDAILASLKRRAEKVVAALRKLEGVSCELVEGALYAFPQIRLPKRAVDAAKAAGKQPDTFYCLALLDATGVCVVPGSGFSQREGTYHFRCTILPPEAEFDAVLHRISVFHKNFMKQWN